MTTKFHLALLLALISCASASLNIFQETYYFAEASTVPVDSNFTVDTFTGRWNIVALYGFPQISSRTCPVFSATKTVTTSLALEIESNNYNTSNFDVIKRTYQPNPLKKGILLYVLDPVPAQNIAVSYYDDTLGLALLINMNSNFAIGLSRSQNVYENMFIETINDIFSEAGLALNQTSLFDHYGCTSNYTSMANLNFSAIPGAYYGNAIYTVSPLLASLECYNMEIQREEGSTEIYNITMHLEYKDFSYNISTNFAPSPVDEAFWINIDDDTTPSLVINYYDPANDIYVFLAHDGTTAFVISPNQSITNELAAIQAALSQEGLNVNSQTFIVMPKICGASGNNAKALLDY